jgi:hypothetical protein
MYKISLLLVTALVLAACSPRSLQVNRPDEPRLDREVSAMWTEEIGRVAQDGDWILTRSYFLVADVIASTTAGEDLSHASIYDAAKGTVIEAVGDGVREIPLETLLQRNHYAIVVRPTGVSEDDGRRALARARGKIGSPFDHPGMFGLDDPDAFYCSELVYWASEVESWAPERQMVITPAALMEYGEVIYWSGSRTDTQVLRAASARSGAGDHRATVASGLPSAPAGQVAVVH